MIGPYREPTLTPPAPERWRVPVGALVLGALLALSGPFAGWIGGLLVLCGLALVGLPATLVRFARGRRGVARRMLVEGTIVAAGALVAVQFNVGAYARSLRNEARIIAAVDRFHADHGRYPATLGELVPRYLPSTHPAGRAYQIMYWTSGESAVLTTTVVPPFGRRTWDFKLRRAGFLD
jgi:hypothetical protein